MRNSQNINSYPNLRHLQQNLKSLLLQFLTTLLALTSLILFRSIIIPEISEFFKINFFLVLGATFVTVLCVILSLSAIKNPYKDKRQVVLQEIPGKSKEDLSMKREPIIVEQSLQLADAFDSVEILVKVLIDSIKNKAEYSSTDAEKRLLKSLETYLLTSKISTKQLISSDELNFLQFDKLNQDNKVDLVDEIR